MFRVLLFLAAAVASYQLFMVAEFGGFNFLGSTVVDIIGYAGAIGVLVFGIILIVFGVKALLGSRHCNGKCNNDCKYCKRSY